MSRAFVTDKEDWVYCAKEAVHGQVKCRVIILNSFDELADGNIRVELFFYFAHKGILRRFTGFLFAAGEFPSSCKITVFIDRMTLNGIIVNNKQKQHNNTD